MVLQSSGCVRDGLEGKPSAGKRQDAESFDEVEAVGETSMVSDMVEEEGVLGVRSVGVEGMRISAAKVDAQGEDYRGGGEQVKRPLVLVPSNNKVVARSTWQKKGVAEKASAFEFGRVGGVVRISEGGAVTRTSVTEVKESDQWTMVKGSGRGVSGTGLIDGKSVDVHSRFSVLEGKGDEIAEGSSRNPGGGQHSVNGFGLVVLLQTELLCLIVSLVCWAPYEGFVLSLIGLGAFFTVRPLDFLSRMFAVGLKYRYCIDF
ncbi:hypothetical protein Dimus_008793 [Dionaea muscipula]